MLTCFNQPADRHRVAQDITLHGGLVASSIPQPRVRHCSLCKPSGLHLHRFRSCDIVCKVRLTYNWRMQMLRGQQLVLVAGRPWNETVQDKSMLAAVTGCAVAKPEWVAACIQVSSACRQPRLPSGCRLTVHGVLCC